MLEISREENQRGIALITTMLVLMLMSALLIGFTTMVISDQRYRFIDHDRGAAFYAASGAVEKLTADLGNTFLANVAPNATQVGGIAAVASQPNMTAAGVTFTTATRPAALPGSSLNSNSCSGVNSIKTIPNGVYGYNLSFCADAAGNPTTIQPPTNIKTGPFEGLVALQTPYQIDVTAKTATGGEVHLSRTIESVAIPVFQFGIFSNADLSFFAGPNFGFGGRVHTNGDLFLSQGGAVPGTNSCATALTDTLTLSGKVTAVKDIIRHRLQNGVSIDAVASLHNGTVCMATGTGFRPLTRAEGSVKDDTGIPLIPNTGWHNISLSAYNLWIRNGSTGAKSLNLPLTNLAVGGANIDVVRRPAANENVDNKLLYAERLYSKASLRILLSDTAADITGLPQVDNTNPPVALDGNWNTALPVAGYGPVTLSSVAVPPINRPPAALSPGPLTATTTNSAGGVINFANNAAAAPFLPKFTFAGFPNNIITCTGKTVAANWELTGCTGVPAMPGTAIGTVLTAISPAGGASGASADTSLATTAVSTRIRFNTAARLNRFNPSPFWDSGTVATPSNTLVTCTGFTGTPLQAATTYTGCSSNPIAAAVLTSAAMSDPGVGTLGGFIKMDRQNADGTWTDVTLEILNYGIGDVNTAGAVCFDPTPNAIIRLQRLRDNAATVANPVLGGGCNYAATNLADVVNADLKGARDPANWWPNVLFDAREALQRDSNYPNPVPAYPAANVSDRNFLALGGVMHYVNIDAGNLARWFRRNTAPFNVGTGNLARVDGTGYTVYFSDRRNNRSDIANPPVETGEYGWEDFVNPASANGVPSGGVPTTGEDVNGNGALEVYGGHPNYTPPGAGGVPVFDAVPPCGIAGALCTLTYGAAAQPASTGYVLSGLARPTWVVPSRVAEVNRAILFRRALMLSNGWQIGTGPGGVAADRLTGLTIVSENPVYIQGDWNANSPAGANFGGLNAASAVIADAVTLLSNQWNDANSFVSPYAPLPRQDSVPPNVGRLVTTAAWYRLAIIGGKGVGFPWIAGTPADFGTDGGAHNFLRFLETFSGATAAQTGAAAVVQQRVNYLGSLATLYYNRQAVGTYKCCATVYGAPVRGYAFDANFLNPALLPPNTPVFRDMNAVGFSQELRPGK